MNPLFLLLMAGGAMAVAAAGNKKRGRHDLRCGADHEGIPRLYFGDEYSVPLPLNVEISAWDGDSQIADCPAIEPHSGSDAPLITIGWDGGRDLRELMEQVVIPAALNTPDVVFRIFVGHHYAGSTRHIEAWIRSPAWGPYFIGGSATRIRLLFVSPTLRAEGIQDPLASVLDAAKWLQYSLTAIREAQVFDWAGNGVHVTKACDFMVGANFLPDPDDFGTTAIEAPTLAEVLAIPGNSAWGYVDYMLTNADLSNAAYVKMKADQIARNILASNSGLGLNHQGNCPVPDFNADGTKWPSGMLLMRDWMAARIGPWVSYESGGIAWEPQNPAGENP